MTLLVVLIGWTFFRAPSFEVAWTMLSKMFTLADGLAWYSPFAIGIIAAMVLYHGFLAMAGKEEVRLRPDSFVTPAILFTMIWLVVAFYPRGFQPFIYFQF